jgi:hypothetical protein
MDLVLVEELGDARGQFPSPVEVRVDAPDGSWWAGIDSWGWLAVWNADGTLRWKAVVDRQQLRALAVAPDGLRLASLEAHALILWDADDGEAEVIALPFPGDHPVDRLTWTPDDRLVFRKRDGWDAVFDLGDRAYVAPPVAPPRPREDPPRPVRADGWSRLESRRSDGVRYIWSTAHGTLGPMGSQCFYRAPILEGYTVESMDGAQWTQVAACGSDSDAWCGLDPDGLLGLAPVPALASAPHAWTVAILPDEGPLLVTTAGVVTARGTTVFAGDAFAAGRVSGELVALSRPADAIVVADASGTRFSRPAQRAILLPDGIAFGAADGTWTVTDIDGDVIRDVGPWVSASGRPAFDWDVQVDAHDGWYAETDRGLARFRASGGTPRTTYATDETGVTAFAVGDRVAIASQRALYVDERDGRRVWTAPLPFRGTGTIAWGPAGAVAVTGSDAPDDAELVVFDGSGARVATLGFADAMDSPTALAWDGDELWVATARGRLLRYVLAGFPD